MKFSKKKIEQSIFDLKLDLLTEELVFTIKKLATAQIIFENQNFIQKNENEKKGKIKLILNKKSGYSTQEVIFFFINF